ncbi:hypothetical protein GCK32_020953, partial [Trichostrongylus colubriformis]
MHMCKWSVSELADYSSNGCFCGLSQNHGGHLKFNYRLCPIPISSTKYV